MTDKNIQDPIKSSKHAAIFVHGDSVQAPLSEQEPPLETPPIDWPVDTANHHGFPCPCDFCQSEGDCDDCIFYGECGELCPFYGKCTHEGVGAITTRRVIPNCGRQGLFKKGSHKDDHIPGTGKKVYRFPDVRKTLDNLKEKVRNHAYRVKMSMCKHVSIWRRKL